NPAGLARLAPPYRPYGLCTVPMLGQASAPARMLAKLRGLDPSIVEARTFLAATWRSHPAMDALRRADVISAHYEVEAVAVSRKLATPLVYYYPGPIDPRRLALCKPERMVAISRMVADYHVAVSAKIPLPPVDGEVLPGIRKESIAESPAPGVATQPPEAIFTGRLDT